MGLHRIINDREMRDAIILIFANKQDLPEAMKPHEIQEKLGLTRLRDKLVCATSMCNNWGWVVRGAYMADKQPQVLRTERMGEPRSITSHSDSCNTEPQLLSVPATGHMPDSLSKQIQIKCFGLGCEINLHT